MPSFTAELLILRDPAVFRPGETVNGCVVINATSPTPLSKIRVRIYGRASTVRKSQYGKEIAVDYPGNADYEDTGSFGDSKVYIDQVKTLLGYGKSSSNQ